MPRKKTGEFVKCANCNELVYIQQWRLKLHKNHFCSTTCNGKFKEINKVKKICEYIGCNNEFEVRHTSNQRFCSDPCSRKYVGELHKNGDMIKCNNCNIEFYRPKWHIKKNKINFCSTDCHNEYMTSEPVKVYCSLIECNNVKYIKPYELNKNGIHFCSTKCAGIAGLRIIQSSPVRNRNTRPEIKFRKLLDDSNINYIHQYSVPWKHGWKKWYDFFIPSINTLIEIDGIYWHGKNKKNSELNEQQMKTRNNDTLKNKLASDMGYHLIRIWSDEIDKFDIEKIKL